MLGRCQICGRRKGSRKDGGLVLHHVRSLRCPGSGSPPIELSDERLASYAAEIDTQLAAVRAELRALEERRANWIDPALIDRRVVLLDLSIKITARLRRMRGWAARYHRIYDRDMMLQGWTWSEKPPGYMISRYLEEIGWTPAAFR